MIAIPTVVVILALLGLVFKYKADMNRFKRKLDE